MLEAFMKETIRELYYGNIFPCERCGSNNSEIKSLAKKLGECRERLTNELTDKQKKLLEEYDNLSSELSCLYHEEFFAEGFSLGAKIVKEAIE